MDTERATSTAPEPPPAGPWTSAREASVVRIRLGPERRAPQPDPLGRLLIGYSDGLTAAELWTRGRGVWKAKLATVAEAALVVLVHDDVVRLVATVDGVTFHADRVAIEGRPLPTHPLIGRPDPVPNGSRNPIAYGAITTVVPSVTPDRSAQVVLQDAVAVLTEAARLRRPVRRPVEGRPGRWETDPQRTEPVDWAEIVTLALAGAAANVGGIEAALKGRPGSWEAAGVRSLLESTVGPDESGLWQHRTEPVEVTIFAEDLIADRTDFWAGYEQAEREMGEQYDAAAAADPEPDADLFVWRYTRGADGAWVPVDAAAPAWTLEAWRAACGDKSSELEAAVLDFATEVYIPRSPELGVEFERLIDAREARLAPLALAVDELLEQQRLREVSEYAQALKHAVEASARDLPGLDVPVNVSVDLSQPTHGPHLAERDALTERLVDDAVLRTPSPDLLPGTPLSRLQEAIARRA